ncbi:hypothetical protein, partial [Corynebacterium mastitidis]
IMDALKTLGYENIAAVGKPVYVEQAPEFDLESLTAEKDIDIEGVGVSPDKAIRQCVLGNGDEANGLPSPRLAYQ